MFEANQDGGMTPRIPRVFVIGFIAFLLILASGGKMFYNVDPGEKAVLFKRFGGGLDKETVYDQGFHIVALLGINFISIMLKFRKIMKLWKCCLKMDYPLN